MSKICQQTLHPKKKDMYTHTYSIFICNMYACTCVCILCVYICTHKHTTYIYTNGQKVNKKMFKIINFYGNAN